MTLPAFLFGFLVSIMFGAGFHLWKGGNAARLAYYIVLAWIGFWGGHALANSWGWTFLSLGPLRLGMAVIGVALVLGGGYWLSLFKPTAPE